jgi:thioester reductase-like protein
VAYFMTGATGFIGRHLLENLLRRKETVYCLVRRQSEDRLQEIALRLQRLKGRVVAVRGDLLKPRLGVAPKQIEELKGTIDHFFHLAALYDLSADSDALARANVDGTRHAMELATALEAGCLHHVSTVAVAGHYEGTFTESMLEQAERLNDPYASTKHDAEVLVRSEYSRPFRIYRPSLVVGHSQTGEIDKIDGLYLMFRMIQRLRDSVPDWLPRIGIETGSANIVPVDYVANAIDHIAHTKDLDGKTFHIVDPQPRKTSEVVDEFCRVAHVPTFSTYLKLPSMPQPIAKLLDVSEQLPAVRRASDALLAELRIPRRLLGYLGHSTEYAADETLKALANSGIEPPPLESYAPKLWDFWERNLANMPARVTRLARAVEGKRVLITNAGGTVERNVALRLAASGAELILVDRQPTALEGLKSQIMRAGGSASGYRADLGSSSDRSAAIARILDLHGGADVLILGAADAAPLPPDSLDELSPQACESAVNQHYLGVLGWILDLLPGMRERESGQIVLLTSMPIDGRSEPARLAAAAALDAFATAIAPDLSVAGIAVTSVHLPPLKLDAPADDAKPARAPLGSVDLARAADVICDALVTRPRRANTWLGTASELTRAAAPQAFEAATSLLSRWPANRWTAWGPTRSEQSRN